MSEPITLANLKEIFAFIDKFSISLVIILAFVLYCLFGDWVIAILQALNVESSQYKLIFIFITSSAFLIGITSRLFNGLKIIFFKIKDIIAAYKADKSERQRVFKLAKGLSSQELELLYYLLHNDTVDFRLHDSNYKALYSNGLIVRLGGRFDGAVFEINQKYRHEIESAIDSKSEQLALNILEARKRDKKLNDLINLFEDERCTELYIDDINFKLNFNYLDIFQDKYRDIFIVIKNHDDFSKTILFTLRIGEHLGQHLNTNLNHSVQFIFSRRPR